MNLRLVVHPRVEPQVATAAAWYEGERRGLGAEFLAEVDRTVLALPATALLYRVRNRRLGVRWALTDRFPYRVLYVVRTDTVLVLAVEHTKRDDTPWPEKT